MGHCSPSSPQHRSYFGSWSWKFSRWQVWTASCRYTGDRTRIPRPTRHGPPSLSQYGSQTCLSPILSLCATWDGPFPHFAECSLPQGRSWWSGLRKWFVAGLCKWTVNEDSFRVLMCFVSRIGRRRWSLWLRITFDLPAKRGLLWRKCFLLRQGGLFGRTIILKLDATGI